ncbi:MAG: class I mannose-6-phosphate isomerase [Sphingomonadales bacterium]|nr:class I mannose-6-phosphate isomerase [Sphingomonadales bacterium]
MTLLPTRMVDKPWGRDTLPPPFEAPAGRRIGEVWFEPPEAVTELLVKYIFTSEKLSVQVHPSDPQTIAAGLGRQGKEECWLVVAADAGAALGIGFDAGIGPDALRAAAMDGSIEQLLTWHPVRPGDFFYIPANTVHAIGGGVSLIEVQQNSDITYRLYDYGRPRALHLEESLRVARGAPYPDALHRHVAPRGEVALVEGPHFRLTRYDGPLSDAAQARFGEAPLLVIPLEGVTQIVGEAVPPGACALALDPGAIAIAPGALGLIAQPLR